MREDIYIVWNKLAKYSILFLGETSKFYKFKPCLSEHFRSQFHIHSLMVLGKWLHQFIPSQWRTRPKLNSPQRTWEFHFYFSSKIAIKYLKNPLSKSWQLEQLNHSLCVKVVVVVILFYLLLLLLLLLLFFFLRIGVYMSRLVVCLEVSFFFLYIKN